MTDGGQLRKPDVNYEQVAIVKWISRTQRLVWKRLGSKHASDATQLSADSRLLNYCRRYVVRSPWYCGGWSSLLTVASGREAIKPGTEWNGTGSNWCTKTGRGRWTRGQKLALIRTVCLSVRTLTSRSAPATKTGQAPAESHVKRMNCCGRIQQLWAQ